MCRTCQVSAHGHVGDTEGSAHGPHRMALCRGSKITLFKAAGLLRRWRTEIINYARTNGASNAWAEAVNHLIKNQKRQVHGYRTWESFRSQIIWCFGEVIDPETGEILPSANPHEVKEPSTSNPIRVDPERGARTNPGAFRLARNWARPASTVPVVTAVCSNGLVRLNVYIDGFNLYYGCVKGTPYKWLDLEALSKRLFPNDEIHRIRYFTALVTGRSGDLRQPQRQQAYIRALETISCLSVHYGHYRSHPVRMPLANPTPGGPLTVEVIRTEEKGSDVNLATYLLLDAFNHDFETAAVISNDSDLREPIAVVRDKLGLPVGVVNPHPAPRRSRVLDGSFFKQIREPALGTSQFPAVLRDAVGQIRKPVAWR